MDETRIFMVDDHNLFREGLSRLLESAPGFRVVGPRRQQMWSCWITILARSGVQAW